MTVSIISSSSRVVIPFSSDIDGLMASQPCPRPLLSHGAEVDVDSASLYKEESLSNCSEILV